MALTKVKLIADGTIVQSHLNASHGITTADIGEGNNLYYTDARARAAVSVSGNALSYNSNTGVITSNYEESPTFTGNVVIDGTLDVNGTEILVGTNNTRLAENNLRFKAASDAYIDQNTVSQAIRFRTSSSSSLDTTPIIIAAGGETTFSTDVYVGGATAARFKSDGTNTIVDAIPNPSSIIFRNSGAVEKMRLDSFGNLGIGTTSPSQKLHVQNGYLLVDTNSAVGSGIWMPDINGNPSLRIVTDQATGSYTSIVNAWGNSSNTGVMLGTIRNDGIAFQVRSGVTLTSGFANDDGSTRFIVKGDGNVGINETNPDVKLKVVGNGNSDTNVLTIGNFEQDDSGDETANIKFELTRSYTNTLNHAGYIKVGKERAWSSSGGRQSFMSFLTRNGSSDPAERMRIASDGKIQAQTSGGYYLTESTTNAFSITSNGANGYFKIRDEYNSSDRFYISNTGNVGIGVSSPAAVLDIYSPYDVTANPNSTGIKLTRVAGGNQSYLLGMGVSGVSNDYFAIRDITNSAYRFVLTNGGNVGIGTTSPVIKLHIAGTTSSPTQAGMSNSSTGDAVFYFDASNGDFAGTDYMGIGQANDLSGFIQMEQNAGSFHIKTGSGGSNRLTVTQGGNVGIGTTSPIAQLDVSGNTNQHHSVSTTHNGGWRNIQNLGVTGWLDQTYSAGRIKVFGFENSNVNVSYCEYYVIRSSAGYHIQQIGTRLDQGNTHGHVEVQISGNFLQVRNVAQSSLGGVRIVFSGMKD